MNKEKFIELIKLGKDAWNKWRENNPNVSISLTKSNFCNSSLSGYNFSDVDFSYSNLSKTDLSNCQFISSNLKHVDFSFSNLEGASFIAAEMSHANFTMTQVKNAKFLTAQSMGANFSHVDFEGHNLQGMDFRQAKFCNANLMGQNLEGMDLSDVDFSEAVLKNASLRNSKLEKANFTDAVLTSVDFRGANLKSAVLKNTDLRHQNFYGMNLEDADLSMSDLRYSNLSHTKLKYAKLTACKLYNASITGWSIKGVESKEAYWDKEGQIVTRYKKSEFERLYAESIIVELKYDQFIAPHEFASLPILIEHLEAMFWGVKLRIKSLKEVAGGTLVKVVIEDTGGINPEKLEKQLQQEAANVIVAQMMMRNDRMLMQEMKESIAVMKEQFWPRLLELALEHDTEQLRMLTVLIMDLKDFSRWQGTELKEKMELFRGLIKPILKRWKANHPNMEGDSLRASFQNAAVGVACACMIQDVLSAAGFSCRIGMDIGEVVVHPNEVTEQVDLSGEVVSFAARLESVCQIGEVLVSERIWNFIRRHDEYFSSQQMKLALEKGVGDLQAGEEIMCYVVKMHKMLK